MRKNMKLGIKLGILLGVMLLGMGCGYSEEEKAEMERFERYGEEYALLYMEDKYDIIPTVIGVECEKQEVSVIPDFSPDANGWVYVDMEHKSKRFCVYINAKDSNELNIDAYDNYQSQEIKDVIAQTLMDLAGGDRARAVEMVYGLNNSLNATRGYLIKDYYNGHNLSQVLENAYYNIAIIYYIQKDTSLADPYTVAERLGNNAEVLYISYRDEDAYGLSKDEDKEVLGYPSTYNIEESALFVEEYTVIHTEGEYEFKEFELEKIDDIYFVNMDGTYCDIEKTTLDDAKNWNGRGFTDARQAYQGYVIATDAKSIQVYCEIEAVDDGNTDTNYQIVLQYEGDEGTAYDTAITREKGGFLGATIHIRDRENLKFSIFENK